MLIVPMKQFKGKWMKTLEITNTEKVFQKAGRFHSYKENWKVWVVTVNPSCWLLKKINEERWNCLWLINFGDWFGLIHHYLDACQFFSDLVCYLDIFKNYKPKLWNMHLILYAVHLTLEIWILPKYSHAIPIFGRSPSPHNWLCFHQIDHFFIES